MIPNGSTNDDRGGNNNNSNNASIERTFANKRSNLFRPYTSSHASRGSNARAVYFTFICF